MQKSLSAYINDNVSINNDNVSEIYKLEKVVQKSLFASINNDNVSINNDNVSEIYKLEKEMQKSLSAYINYTREGSTNKLQYTM
jgi:hypothetical protein